MKYLFLAMSALLILVACGKKPTSTPNRADILRTGKWKVSSGTITVNLPNGRDTTLDYMTFIPACHRDDYILFDSGNAAAIYSGGSKCNAGDPDHIDFVWLLHRDNESLIDLYGGFNNTFGIVDTIQPFQFDTLSTNPYLVLDTLLGVFDTAHGYTRVVPVLDTIWKLKFQYDSSVITNPSIYGATITDFSQSSFTLHYNMSSLYPDSSGFHTRQYVDPNLGIRDFNPIMRPDTVKYSIKYTNF